MSTSFCLNFIPVRLLEMDSMDDATLEHKNTSSEAVIKFIKVPDEFANGENEKKKLVKEESTGVVKEVKLQKGVQELVKEVDSCYSWLVVFFSFLSCFVVGVLFISFSLLYLEFAEYFEAERGPVGWIGSMYLAVGNFFGWYYPLLFFLIFLFQ